MRKLKDIHKWLMVILVALLATSATAGLELVVTNPVTAIDTDLILYGDDYISITVSDACDVYGMAALLEEESVANITILSPLITDISVTASGSGAYAMYVDAGTIFSNDIYGSLTAVAADSAYGIDASTVVVGQLTGAISATANDGTGAYGLWGNDLVSVYSVSEDGAITVSALDGGAYGIGSSAIVGITDAMDGTITVTGQGDDNYGIYGTEVSIGDIGGTITVTTNGESADGAYGIYADTTITIGDISGDISATANDNDAYAMYADEEIEIGDISGTITADAGGSNAYGIWSENGNYVIVGNISGSITATADANSAYGVSAWAGSLDTGDISGDIAATAGGSNAVGLYAYESYIDTGDIHGSITATATDNAYGIFSESGEGGGSVYVGDVNGVISAEATEGSYAFGIYGDAEVYIDSVTSDGAITATATDEAYGIYGGDLVVIGSEIMIGVSEEIEIAVLDGDITAETTDGSNAYGIYSGGDVYIESMGENGSITATSAGDYAYGIYANDSVYMGNIAGSISADANGTAEATDGDSAYGIYASNDIETGDISGDITAVAESEHAYGVYASDGHIDTGNISGEISATAGVSDAIGLYAYQSYIDIGDMSEGSTISAWAQSDARGIYSESGEGGGDITIGHIDGEISADTSIGNDAYAIYADEDVIIDDVGYDGHIWADAAGDNAYGIYAVGDVTIGDGETEGYIDGDIEADAGGDNAYGIYAGGDVSIVDGIYGNVDAWTGDDNAYGIYAVGDITIGEIDGEIWAEAYGDNAYAIYSDNGSVTLGTIYGNIEVDSEYDTAYAIYADGDITIDGIDEDGSIYANTYDDYAIGIYSYAGNIDTGTINGYIDADGWYDVYAITGGGTLTTTIGPSGYVEADADGDDAVVLSSYGPMDILVNRGELYAYADDGSAWAIRSGYFDGDSFTSQDANDTVEIVAGSDIEGDIDLYSMTDNDVLTLSGEDYYTGYITGDITNVEDVNITGGTWYVDGDATNNLNGIYMTGGELNWLGSVETLNIQGGIFSPGNSIGTTTVTGDFTLAEDSTFVVEVSDDPCEPYDRVVVTGIAVIEGGVIAPTAEHFINTEYVDEDEAVIITTEGGLDLHAEFDEEFTPYFDYVVNYYEEEEVTDYVSLDITPADFTEYAVTDNQNSVGNALNSIREQGEDMDEDTQDILVLIRNLQNEAEDGAPGLLDELTPQDALGLAQVSGATMFTFNDTMFDRIGNVLTGRPYAMAGFGQKLYASADGSLAATSTNNEWRPFVKAIGSWGDHDAESGVSGYSYNLYGMTAGADKIVSDNWLLGISFGGSMASVDYDKVRTEADIDTAMVALYGSYFKDNWHIDFTLGYGHNWYDSERSIEIGPITEKAESDHKGNMYSVALQAGMNLGEGTTIIEPIIGGGYTSIREEGYTETGADPLNLKVDSHTTDALYSKVGIRLATEMKDQDNTVLVPEVGAFWIHDFSDAAEIDSEFADGSAFTVEGIEPDDTINLTAGLNAYFSSDWRLFVNYGWQTSSDFSAHTVKAGIQWNF